MAISRRYTKECPTTGEHSPLDSSRVLQHLRSAAVHATSEMGVFARGSIDNLSTSDPLGGNECALWDQLSLIADVLAMDPGAGQSNQDVRAARGHLLNWLRGNAVAPLEAAS